MSEVIKSLNWRVVLVILSKDLGFEIFRLSRTDLLQTLGLKISFKGQLRKSRSVIVCLDLQVKTSTLLLLEVSTSVIYWLPVKLMSVNPTKNIKIKILRGFILTKLYNTGLY